VMKRSILEAISLADYALKDSDLENLDARTVVVTKWNWEYSIAHQFQRVALTLVQNTPNLRVLICCNHPKVLTHGRGLQRPKKGEVMDLINFNPDHHPDLPYTLHKVERGGGLTFHHPGQFIFYPIVKLNPKSLSLSLMIDQIFDFSIDVLKSWGLEGLNHENKLLGLWHGHKKIASMGIAIEKLTTFHGMALNINQNKDMTETLSLLNPCGLNPETYTSVEDLIKLPSDGVENFKNQFLKRVQSEWK
jgi:lipoyl(octanoyl) transferase